MKKLLLTTILVGFTASASQAFFWNSDDDDNKKGHDKDRLSIEEVFEKGDTDKDGKLSKEEFTAHHDAMKEKYMNKKGKGKGKGMKGKKEKRSADEIFTEMDADADGFVSQEEMKAHHEMRKEKREERRKERSNG